MPLIASFRLKSSFVYQPKGIVPFLKRKGLLVGEGLFFLRNNQIIIA